MTENSECRLTPQDEVTDFLLYTAPDGQVKVECVLHDETIWLTQKRIAELFGVGVPAVSKHLDNIYQDGELLKDATVSILETVQQEGSRQVKRKLDSFAESVNRFLEFNEYRILKGYGSSSRKKAEEKAFSEYDKFNKTQKIESDFDKMIKQLPSGEK